MLRFCLTFVAGALKLNLSFMMSRPASLDKGIRIGPILYISLFHNCCCCCNRCNCFAFLKQVLNEEVYGLITVLEDKIDGGESVFFFMALHIMIHVVRWLLKQVQFRLEHAKYSSLGILLSPALTLWESQKIGPQKIQSSKKIARSCREKVL